MENYYRSKIFSGPLFYAEDFAIPMCHCRVLPDYIPFVPLFITHIMCVDIVVLLQLLCSHKNCLGGFIKLVQSAYIFL